MSKQDCVVKRESVPYVIFSMTGAGAILTKAYHLNNEWTHAVMLRQHFTAKDWMIDN